MLLLLFLSFVSALSKSFTDPVADQYFGYGTYTRACLRKGALVWDSESRVGSLDWSKPITILVETPSSWFEERNNFYHM